MIVIDTSALVSIIRAEPNALVVIDRIAAHEAVLLPATAFVEAALVLCGRKGPAGLDELRAVVAQYGFRVVPSPSLTRKRRPRPSSPTARAATRPRSTSATA